MQLGVRFFSRLCWTWPGEGTLARKTSLAMNWYSLLGHACIFSDVIVSYLIT